MEYGLQREPTRHPSDAMALRILEELDTAVETSCNENKLQRPSDAYRRR